MKILAFGDIYGRVWRNGLLKELPQLQQRFSPDITIANVDNISSWRWAIPMRLEELEKAWVDIMCSGDHFFDNEKDLVEYMAKKDCRLIRPANFYEVGAYPVMGKWYTIFEKNGKKIAVIHLMGQVFMRYEVYNPFLKLQELLAQDDIQSCNAIVVDFHKEATSEIGALWRFFDGKISAVYGTHTHIQTNDDDIFEGGTGFLSDVGMCGPKNSVIWADVECLRGRFFTGLGKGKISQSLDSRYLVHGVFFETDDQKKNVLHIEKIKIIWTL